ncbi:MAG: hypothetical protein NC337_14300 [Roseburia sp.]|nr:hypothetical protein [Roseburia sp.]
MELVGNVSNSIAAVCAVVTIIITVQNFRNDKQEQKKEKLRLKLSELYKQAVIDSMLKLEDEKIRYINDRLYQVSSSQFDETVMKELYEYMEFGMHDCLREAEIIKLFNLELCQKTKQSTEHIFDAYSQIINKSMSLKFIPKNFDRTIRREWLELRRYIYECYIKEDFDKAVM